MFPQRALVVFSMISVCWLIGTQAEPSSNRSRYPPVVFPCWQRMPPTSYASTPAPNWLPRRWFASVIGRLGSRSRECTESA